MQNLQNKITNDLNNALKNKDSTRLSTLRLLKADLQYEMSKDGASELSDKAVADLLRRAAKKRRESIEQYKKAQRPELAAKEETELKILEEYLPPAVSDVEVQAALAPIWQKIQPKGAQDMGKLMGAVMGQFKGQNIDGARVRQLIQEKLDQNSG